MNTEEFNKRNGLMKEIIDIEEVQHPHFYRKQKAAQGKIAVLTTKKMLLWKRYKKLFKGE